MSYHIVVDSCGELPEKLKKDGHFENVPLEIFVDDYHIIDDESFDRRAPIAPSLPVLLRSAT